MLIHAFYPSSTEISTAFGLVAMAAGVIGVPLGAEISRRLRRYFDIKSDAYVCCTSAVGALFFCVPFLLTTPHLGFQLYTVMFFGQVFLNMGWAVVVDIAMVRKVSILEGLAKNGQLTGRDFPNETELGHFSQQV